MIIRLKLLVGILFLNVEPCYCWISTSTTSTSTSSRLIRIQKHDNNNNINNNWITTKIQSTPFEADFYKNPYENDDDNLLLLKKNTNVPIDTKLIIGLNKYSHDTAICAADANTGKILFAMSKERITRIKHDSGNIVSLIEICLNELDLQLDNIQSVIMNNHHHRIIPLEQNIKQLEWECGLNINGGIESGYDEPENLLLDVSIKHELSHHLAHAYSTATQSPFNNGLCIVMDGMGETFRTMYNAINTNDTAYTSDLSFGINTFQCIPSNIIELASNSIFDYREAESVYTFEKYTNNNTINLKPIFKRFIKENSPPTLYNHGFENMDSIGALYSRVSSHIFGDWNACGKVMGLAPWANYKWTIDDPNNKNKKKTKTIQPKLHKIHIMSGKLQSENDDDKFTFNKTLMEGIPFIARTDPDLFDINGIQKKRYDFDDNDAYDNNNNNNKDDNIKTQRLPTQVALDAISLAYRIQIDLETIVIDFVKHFKIQTNENNLCLAGGVILNSVLNGKLARELNFNNTFISPYPGDDGIAVGCCAFGLYGNINLINVTKLLRTQSEIAPPIWTKPLSPYQGPDPTDNEIKMILDEAEPWIEIETIRNVDERIQIMATEVERGSVIAWYRSRSELGPRALGHRSILADPRKKGLVRFINEHVKSRESFRPFAPSVLAEEASKWFDLGPNVPNDNNVSPFMSMTALVHEEKRQLIPAVTHVDGSSRMQTVTKDDEPIYHKFISKFYELTGIPMVLNTSFNTLPSEPIVESPKDAIRSFLYAMGSIEMLIIGDYIIRRKKPDLQKLLGEATKDGYIKTQPVCPKRAGPVQFQTTFDLDDNENNNNNSNNNDVVTTTKVRMPNRLIHGKKSEWVELLDDLEGELLAVCDGTVTLNEIMAQYTTENNSNDKSINNEKDIEDTQNLLQNIVHRMVRLYEETLIGW